jgi:hypothetical protein
LHAAVEFLLGGGEPYDFSLRFGQLELVGGQFVFSSGLLGDQASESVMISLQAITLRRSGGKQTCDLRGLIGAPAGFGSAQIVLRAEQFGASFGKLRGGIFHIKLQKELTFLYRLPFLRADFLDEGVELCAHYEGRNRLHFAVAGERSDDIFADRHDRGNLGDRLATAQGDEHDRGDGGEEQEDQNSVSEPAIHVWLRTPWNFLH